MCGNIAIQLNFLNFLFMNKVNRFRKKISSTEIDIENKKADARVM